MSTPAAISSGVSVGGADGGASLKFYLATLTFQRARQLQNGARPRVDSRGHTLVRVALLEVMAGLISSQGDA